MTPFGDRKKVKVIRNTNSKNEVFYVNLTEIDVLNNKDFMLQPHDIVYVAPVKKKFYAINISNAVSLFLFYNYLFINYSIKNMSQIDEIIDLKQFIYKIIKAVYSYKFSNYDDSCIWVQ